MKHRKLRIPLKRRRKRSQNMRTPRNSSARKRRRRKKDASAIRSASKTRKYKGRRNPPTSLQSPHPKCRLLLLKLERVKPWLTVEEEFINNCESLSTRQEKQEDQRNRFEEIRGSTMFVGTLEEMIDDDRAIVSRSMQDFYVPIASFVD